MDNLLIPPSPELTTEEIQRFSSYAKQLGKAQSAPILRQQNGQDISRKKGHGIELREIRPYVSTDDVRHMDWRVTARTGTPHTRVYTEDVEHRTFIICSFSKDAYFGTETTFISTRLTQIAALIGWRSYITRDPLSMLTCQEQSYELTNIVRDWQTWGQGLAYLTKIDNRACSNLYFNLPNHLLVKGSNIVILSDQMFVSEKSRAILTQLAKHNRVHWLSLEDANTFSIPDGIYQFSHQKKAIEINTAHRKEAKQRYLEQFQKHHQLLVSLGIPKLSFNVNESPIAIVKTLLNMGALH